MKFFTFISFLFLISLSTSVLSFESSIIKESITEKWRYKWTQGGTLSKVIHPDTKHVDFTYDALGRRLTKTYQDQTTHFVWDEGQALKIDPVNQFSAGASLQGGQALHEWTSGVDDAISQVNDKGEREIITPENLTTWIFEDGTFIPMAKLQGEKSYSIITDHLGTPTEAYDEDGEKVWSRQLNIYGETRKETGVENFIPYLYQGQYLDTETELAYNRFRYYSPETGSYLSLDPLKLKGGLNLYSYVSDSSSLIDPLGWVEQGRDASGKFLAKNAGDTAPGSDAVNDVLQELEADPKTRVLGEEISFKDQDTGQIRRYDIVTQDIETGKITGIEVKNSPTASYGKPQRTFDAKVNSGSHNIIPTGNKAKNAGVTKIDDVKVKRC